MFANANTLFEPGTHCVRERVFGVFAALMFGVFECSSAPLCSGVCSSLPCNSFTKNSVRGQCLRVRGTRVRGTRVRVCSSPFVFGDNLYIYIYPEGIWGYFLGPKKLVLFFWGPKLNRTRGPIHIFWGSYLHRPQYP